MEIKRWRVYYLPHRPKFTVVGGLLHINPRKAGWYASMRSNKDERFYFPTLSAAIAFVHAMVRATARVMQ